jgi:hemerythrin-like domain-containing protein
VQDFAQCHAGIIGQLHVLDELPALLEPAARARRIAADTIRFFRDVVYEHHQEEERDLFPAVIASAADGPEREKVERIVAALTAEHRAVEAEWERLEPGLKAVARGHDADLPPGAVEALVQTYLAHARYEEEDFLPLSQQILGRNRNHLAALGVALHLRHSVPRMIDRFAGRI